MHNRSTSRSPWRRGLGLTVVLLGALFLPACNDTTTNVPGVSRALIVVSVVPNPVIGAQQLTGSVSAAYIVNVREVGGLGGEIQFVNSTVFDPEAGIQVASNYFDSAALIVFVGTARVDAQGELDVTQTVNYVLPDFRLDADLTVNVQFLDDNGNLSTESVLVRIVPPPAE